MASSHKLSIQFESDSYEGLLGEIRTFLESQSVPGLQSLPHIDLPVSTGLKFEEPEDLIPVDEEPKKGKPGPAVKEEKPKEFKEKPAKKESVDFDPDDLFEEKSNAVASAKKALTLDEVKAAAMKVIELKGKVEGAEILKKCLAAVMKSPGKLKDLPPENYSAFVQKLQSQL